MKLCSKCSVQKIEEEFSWKNKTKGVRSVWCKECMKTYDRVRYTDTDRPAQAKANRDAAVSKNREYFLEVLRSSKCVDCGISDVRVLHFDHRPDESKIKDVVAMVITGYSIASIEAEIAKCDCRCANHHMIITAERGNWWRANLDK
jgi:hypothetical protein